jgi:hypothetical protein
VIEKIRAGMERAWDSLAEMDSLVSEETGELRSFLQTIAQLVSHQTKLFLALGLAPTVAAKIAKTQPLPDLEAMRNAETVAK